MQRILVMGSSGSGKSTFASGLSDARTWMAGILMRIASSYGRVRPEMAEGCPEKIDFEFFHYVWTFRDRRRPKMLKYFEGLRPDQAFVTFTQRVQADRYLLTLAPSASPLGTC